jgi:transposase-like protein
MAANQGCSGHENHMCQLVERKTDVNKLKAYVRGAKYICKSCGRASVKEENVCAPEKM